MVRTSSPVFFSGISMPIPCEEDRDTKGILDGVGSEKSKEDGVVVYVALEGGEGKWCMFDVFIT